MNIGALAPWYGSNRLLAHHVGEKLKGLEWVGIPFGGGMCEVPCIDARTIVVGDLHRHIINLANVVADRSYGPQLYRRLNRLAFHPDVLAQAQAKCAEIERMGWMPNGPLCFLDLKWAEDYFVCCWMGRSCSPGTGKEFEGGIATRWSATGGDSAVRFRNAARGLRDWQKIMLRCTFVCQDVFEFLDNVIDKLKHGIYLDPPFPGPGDRYKHRFTAEQHFKLAARLVQFKLCKVVCRFYDHPVVRELYPEKDWEWTLLTGRKQSNEAAPEVLLTRRVAA